ncbi:keto-acid formate acetyltransferase [Citrobacter koseri]|uniref:Keto-acid formate acetyltransferase n=1 Tax=Citrobacter koseri TaxID=545 RepID=A0A2X2W849_CITKO|nr:keto-acid formate acetyltransferase [Citrobacter koseri]
MESLDHFMDWLAVQYISALNIIHYMHDKYSYEASLMALHDRDVYRTMACGIAGLSVATDSLSAIKYAKVKPVRDHNGLAVDFVIGRRISAVRQQRRARGQHCLRSG